MTPSIEDATEFIVEHPHSAMISVRRDCSPHSARVELAVVDGRIRTSGAPGLVRTAHLRRDPRCTLFVFGPPPLWVGVDAVAHILDGPDAADHCIELMRARHGRPTDTAVVAHDPELGADRRYEEDEYRDYVRARKLFVFDFDIVRTYGNQSGAPEGKRSNDGGGGGI